MPEYDTRKLGVIDTSKIISIYMILEVSDIQKEGLFKVLSESIGDVAEMKGKAVEDITVGVAEFEEGTSVEVKIMFSTIDIETSILRSIIKAIEGMPPVENIEESIVTSNLNRTMEIIHEKKGFVG